MDLRLSHASLLKHAAMLWWLGGGFDMLPSLDCSTNHSIPGPNNEATDVIDWLHA
jgi:coproporphyrinogen III oxidase